LFFQEDSLHMKRFLFLALTVGLIAPTPLKAEISQEVHNACKDVKDYKGCVEMRSSKANQYAKGTRVLEGIEGNLKYLFNPSTVVARQVNGEWGRYINYREYETKDSKWSKDNHEYAYDADCKDYKVNDRTDGEPWFYLKDTNRKDITEILDEFCPQMDRLVKEAKSGSKKYFQYQPSLSLGLDPKIRVDIVTTRLGISLFNPETVAAKRVKKEWGRYITYSFYQPGQSSEWKVTADCKEYSADWKNDKKGWLTLRDKEGSKEALTEQILDEFCPQMDRLVKIAKSGSQPSFRYPITNSGNSRNSGDIIRALSGVANSVNNNMRMNRIEQNQRVIQQQQMYNQIDSYGSGGAGGGPGSYY